MKIKFTDKYTYPKPFSFSDKFHLPKEHKWLNKLPLKLRYKVIKFLYQIGIIKKIGYGKIVQRDPAGNIVAVSEFYNIIVDVGVTQVRNILAGTSTNLPKNIEFGTGTSTPLATDTDVQTPLDTLGGGGDKTRLVGTVSTPGSYEIRVEAFLSSTYGPTRPYTINNFGLFFDPEESGTMFAHALVSPGHVMSSTNTADATYGILLR